MSKKKATAFGVVRSTEDLPGVCLAPTCIFFPQDYCAYILYSQSCQQSNIWLRTGQPKARGGCHGA